MSNSQPRISAADYLKQLNQGEVKKRKSSCYQPEEIIHRSCIEWAVAHENRYPVLRFLMHSPNGGKRSASEAGRLKAMGVKPGYPDLTLPFGCGEWKGLAVELKAGVNKPTPNQLVWLARMKEDGWLTGVGTSVDDFIVLVKMYLTGKR